MKTSLKDQEINKIELNNDTQQQPEDTEQTQNELKEQKPISFNQNQFFENFNELFDPSRPPPPPPILQFQQNHHHQPLHHSQQQIQLSQQPHQFLMSDNEISQVQQHQQLLQHIGLIQQNQQQCFIRCASSFQNNSTLQTPQSNIMNNHLMPILTQTQLQSNLKSHLSAHHQQRATISHGMFLKLFLYFKINSKYFFGKECHCKCSHLLI